MSATAEEHSATTHVQMTYLDALMQAQIEELDRDERVIMMGEDIGVYGGGGDYRAIRLKPHLEHAHL